MDQNASSAMPVTPMPTPMAPISDVPVPDAPTSDVPIPGAPASDTSVPNPAVVSAPPAPTLDSSPIVNPDPSLINSVDAAAEAPDASKEVIKKIAESQNVLVALSSDPSVDEMAAAIGLSLFLDRLGKRATAIYSGSTPNALEFLKPEETFETSADTLQDFVIALNKDKADHLRYKLDGDYVKIYITPYKARIGEEDLEFSYGDYNVDLVLALDVANGIDLDSALREHGRIMHDAVIVNITTGNPGRFGEIEWSDKTASSVSEMIARLLYNVNSKTQIEKGEATAFLTGIVAATNRFSNAKTTPSTMQVASRLMQSGANQQLISKNITPDVDNELYSLASNNAPKHNDTDNDPTKLDIEHDQEKGTDETKEVEASINEETSTLLDDLKAAEASLAAAGSEIVPDTSNQPINLDNSSTNATKVEDEIDSAPDTTEETPQAPEPTITTSIDELAPSEDATTEPHSEPIPEPAPEPTPEPALPPVMSPSDFTTEEPTSTDVAPEPSLDEVGAIGDSDKPEKIIQPSPDMDLSAPDESSDKYGKMLEDTISGLGDTSAPTTSIGDNPASAMAPQVASAPEINGVPEMNYMPMPGEEVLPPPPAPPIDMSAPVPEASVTPAESITSAASTEPVEPIQPAMPPIEPTPTPLGPQPAMQDQVYTPQASDPGAFKIPGM